MQHVMQSSQKHYPDKLGKIQRTVVGPAPINIARPDGAISHYLVRVDKEDKKLWCIAYEHAELRCTL
jgi:hypothetical protein